MAKVRVQGGEDAKADANFKEILAKQGAAVQEQAKKRDEEQQKFQGIKAHYEAGVGFLNQASQANTHLAKAPADPRDAKKQEMQDLSDKAVTELEPAQTGPCEKDAN